MKRSSSKPQQIYFDTNPLLAAGWPNASTQLLEVLQLVNVLNVKVAIPVAAIEELEQHWIRELRREWRETKGKLQNLNKKANSVVSFPALKPLPTERKLEKSLRALVSDSYQKFVLIPMTKRPLNHFFSDATQRVVPFEDGGKGFQDAVILHSVLDHMLIEKIENGFFVSADRIFLGTACAQLIKASAVGLQIVENLDKLRTVLEKYLEAEDRQRRENERKQLIRELESHIENFENYITTNLQPFSDYANKGLTKRIISAKVASIDDAHIAEQRENFRQVSVELTVKFQLEIEPFLVPGSSPPLGISAILDTYLRPTRTEVIAVTKPVVVEADATTNQGTGFEKVTPTSVRINNDALGLGDRWAAEMSLFADRG